MLLLRPESCLVLWGNAKIVMSYSSCFLRDSEEWQVMLSQVLPCLWPTLTSYHISPFLFLFSSPAIRPWASWTSALREVFLCTSFRERGTGSGHDSYSVARFKLRWGWKEGKRWKGWRRQGEREEEENYKIMSIFSGHLCSFLLPLNFTFAVETLQSVFPLWKFVTILCFSGRFLLIKHPQFLHDLFLLFFIT